MSAESQPYVHGELLVRLERPVARFGLALTIAKRAGSDFWVAEVVDGGELFWNLQEPGVVTQPTMFLDEELADAIHRELAGSTLHTRGSRIVDHLEDSMAVRNRLMDWVERLIPTSPPATSINVHNHTGVDPSD